MKKGSFNSPYMMSSEVELAAWGPPRGSGGEGVMHLYSSHNVVLHKSQGNNVFPSWLAKTSV